MESGPMNVADFFFVAGCGDDLHVDMDVISGYHPHPLNRKYRAKVLTFCPESPRTSKADQTSVEFPDNVEQFCFPEHLCLRLDEGPVTYHSFVMTELNGDRVYASCLTFYELAVGNARKHYETLYAEWAAEENVRRSVHDTTSMEVNHVENGEVVACTRDSDNSIGGCSGNILCDVDRVYVPKCIGITSHMPLITVFRQFLARLLHLVRSGTAQLPVERYVVNFLHEVPLPPPGQVAVTFDMDGVVLNISRPPVNYYYPLTCNFSFEPVFQLLDVNVVVSLFSALVVERKVMVVSSSLSMLHHICEAFLALLYPFSWQHVYIPVLPSTMLSFLHAPMPYLVGVCSSYKDQEEKPEGVIVVDLDTGTVESPDPLPSIPSHQLKKLLARLEAANVSQVYGARPRGADRDIVFPAPEHLSLSAAISARSSTFSSADISSSTSCSVASNIRDSSEDTGNSQSRTSRMIPPTPSRPAPLPPNVKPTRPPPPLPQIVPTLATEDFSGYFWFEGTISRKEAEIRVVGIGEGKGDAFIIRESESRPGSYSLTARVSGSVKHFMINPAQPSGVMIGEPGKGKLFNSMQDLAKFYCKTLGYHPTQELKSTDKKSPPLRLSESRKPSVLSTMPQTAPPPRPSNPPPSRPTSNATSSRPSNTPPPRPSTSRPGRPSNSILQRPNILPHSRSSDVSRSIDSKHESSQILHPPRPSEPMKSRNSQLKSSSDSVSIRFSTAKQGDSSVTRSTSSLSDAQMTEGYETATSEDCVLLRRSTEKDYSEKRSSVTQSSSSGIDYPRVKLRTSSNEEGNLVTAHKEKIRTWGRPRHRKSTPISHTPGMNGGVAEMSFDEGKVREAFLNMWVSFLKDYRRFLLIPEDDNFDMPRELDTINWFDKEGFLAAEKDVEAKPYITELLDSQAFAQFAIDRIERDPNDFEVLFFDSSIKAKLNRSILKRTKDAVPFLNDSNYGIKNYHRASAASAVPGVKQLNVPTTEKSIDGIKAPIIFPEQLNPSLLGHYSVPAPLITDHALVNLKAHTNALTRGARVHKQARSQRLKDALVKLHDDAGLPISEARRFRFNLQISEIHQRLVELAIPESALSGADEKTLTHVLDQMYQFHHMLMSAADNVDRSTLNELNIALREVVNHITLHQEELSRKQDSATLASEAAVTKLLCENEESGRIYNWCRDGLEAHVTAQLDEDVPEASLKVPDWLGGTHVK